MPGNIDSFYEEIKDLQTKKEFIKEIKKRQKESDFLFDEETSALLIVDELGRNQENICKINSLKPGVECTVHGCISKVKTQRSFNRKNGSNGRVANLELNDETGSCGLVLWDRDVDLVKNKTIQVGTNVKIINGYIKDGYTGIEVNIGRWGLIEVEPGDIPKVDGVKVDLKNNDFSGEIVEVMPTTAFFKDTGEFGFVAKIVVKNKDGRHLLTIWDEKVKEIQKYKVGDKISIDSIDLRKRNGESELHINGNSTIKKL